MNVWALIGEYLKVLFGIGSIFFMLSLAIGTLVSMLRGTSQAQMWGAFSTYVVPVSGG